MLTLVGVAARSDTHAQTGKGDAGEGNCVLRSEIHPHSMPDYFGWPMTVIERLLNPVGAATNIGAWYGNDTHGPPLSHRPPSSHW